MNKYKLLLITFLLFTILPYSIRSLSDKVFAQSNTNQLLRISPVIFFVQLSPDKEYEYQLTVENLQDFAIPIRITQEDFVIEDDTSAYSFEENQQNSLVKWITIGEKEDILEPHEKKQIDFTVTTPQTINFGGYHGMIFVEPLFPGIEKYSSKLATKIGTPVIASIGGANTQMNPFRILTMEYPQFITDTQDFAVNLRIQNNSLFHASAKPILELKPIWGDERKIFLDEKLIFPGKIRTWETTTNIGPLSPNIYKATLLIAKNNSNQIGKNFYLVFIPLKFLFIVAIIFASSILYLLIRKRKIHVRAFFETLVKK